LLEGPPKTSIKELKKAEREGEEIPRGCPKEREIKVIAYAIRRPKRGRKKEIVKVG